MGKCARPDFLCSFAFVWHGHLRTFGLPFYFQNRLTRSLEVVSAVADFAPTAQTKVGRSGTFPLGHAHPEGGMRSLWRTTTHAPPQSPGSSSPACCRLAGPRPHRSSVALTCSACPCGPFLCPTATATHVAWALLCSRRREGGEVGLLSPPAHSALRALRLGLQPRLRAPAPVQQPL